MIVEHALLPVRPGSEADFEAAMTEAKAIIVAAPGFIAMTVSRGVEQPNVYLLLVEWRTLDDHTQGFRGSPAYDEWRRLLHHFYEPFPDVTHFEQVARA